MWCASRSSDASSPASRCSLPSTDAPVFGSDEGIEIARGLLPVEDGLFALQVKGDSMIDAMVGDGDIVVMRRQPDWRNGDMVAVWLRSKEETTLKHIYKEGSRIRLQPANPTMKRLLRRRPGRRGSAGQGHAGGAAAALAVGWQANACARPNRAVRAFPSDFRSPKDFGSRRRLTRWPGRSCGYRPAPAAAGRSRPGKPVRRNLPGPAGGRTPPAAAGST